MFIAVLIVTKLIVKIFAEFIAGFIVVLITVVFIAAADIENYVKMGEQRKFFRNIFDKIEIKSKLARLEEAKKQEKLTEVPMTAELTKLAGMLMEAKKQEELDENDPELLPPPEVSKELDVMGKPKLVKIKKEEMENEVKIVIAELAQVLTTDEVAELAKIIMEAKKQELNMEGNIKTLKSTEAGDIDCILFELKNKAKNKKLEPSLDEEDQQE